MPEIKPAREALNSAIKEFLSEYEISISSVLVVDVANLNGKRYVAARYGGGADGNEIPMIWTAVGLLEAALLGAKDQLVKYTTDVPEDEDG